MANSYVEHTNSGTGTNGLGQKIFTVPTNFININDIVAKGYNGSSWTELTIASRGTTTVELSAIPTGYTTLRLFRRSTTEPIVDFQNGATLSESDLDTAYRQGLYVAQEVAEDADPDGGSGIANISNSQLAGGITNDKLAGSISDDKLASGVGTSADNLVKLDSSARLPAVDGSQLTNVASISTGTFTPTWDGYSSPYSTSGSYVKIGTQVFVYAKLVTNSATDTSEVQINNLPYTVSGDLGGGLVYHDRTSLYGQDLLTKFTANSTICKLQTVTGASNVVGVKYVDSGEPTLGGFTTLIWTLIYQTS